MLLRSVKALRRGESTCVPRESEDMGDGNAFDRHSTYNPDRDADMLGDFSSDLFSPYTSQDSSQVCLDYFEQRFGTEIPFKLPTYHPEWSSPNATFPTGERVGPNVHPISEKLYQPLQGSWVSGLIIDSIHDYLVLFRLIQVYILPKKSGQILRS